MKRRRPAAGRLVLEVLARPPVDRRGTGLVVGRRRRSRPGRRRVATMNMSVTAGVDARRHGRDPAPGGRSAASAASSRALVGRAAGLGGRELAAAPAIETDSSSSGVSPLVPMAPTTSPSTVERNAAGQRGGAVKRERTEAPVGDLLLHLAAGPHEDRGGARLVDRDARARDLRARRAPQRDELAPRVDDGDYDAQALRECVALGGLDHRLGAGLIDDPAGDGRCSWVRTP